MTAQSAPEEWNGRPSVKGWHWLRRRKGGDVRMAFWTLYGGWRVADEIGRTTIRSESFVAKKYTHLRLVAEPLTRASDYDPTTQPYDEPMRYADEQKADGKS